MERHVRVLLICACVGALVACGADASSDGTAIADASTAHDAGNTGGSGPEGRGDATDDTSSRADTSGRIVPGGDASSEEYYDTGGGWDGQDASADAIGSGSDEEEPIGNTNVNLGGAQDFGYFRRQLDDGQVPVPGTFEAAGFFAEHHTPLPIPNCGEKICLQAMLGVLTNLFNGNECTMLQLGLNSPIVADPSARPPLTLTVVVDISGSMSQAGKLTFVRDGLEMLIDALRDSDQIALVTYAGSAQVAHEMTTVDMNRAGLRRAVRDIRAHGGTNIYEGLRLGYETALLHYDSGRQNRVIFLSDGQATSGITSSDGILSISAEYNSMGIGITSVGLGTDFDYELMRDLAERGDGNFYFLESAGAVREVFTEEISYFTVPVAFDLELELESGSDYMISAVHGSRLWQASRDGGRLEIPSVFLAHRESHDDVTEDGGRRGGGSALIIELMPRRLSGPEDVPSRVGRATLRFREPGTDRIVEQEVTVDYPYAPFVMLRGGHFDAPNGRADIVQKSFVMLNTYVAMESACVAFHSGSAEDVNTAELENLVRALEDYNEEIGDVDIEFDIALVRQLISVLISHRVPPRPADPIEDPWPVD